MAYCYQCGEQIAESGIFCPYCGISLKPVAVAGEDAQDDSFSKTIAIEQTPTAAENSAAMGGGAGEIQSSSELGAVPMKERLGGESEPGKINDISIEAVAENAEFEIESIEMSPEQIEREIDLAEEAERAAEEEELNRLKTLSEGKSPAANFPGIAASEQTAASADAVTIEETNLEPVFISTEDETAENTASAVSPAEDNRSAIENSVGAEQPIAMPDVELPAADSCPPSKFDSVSIMEKKPEVEVIEPTPAKIEIGDSRREQPPGFRMAHVSATAAEEEKPSRSYTTPNIGGENHTAGRNKAKLKPLDEGTVLNNRYEIIRKIGGGGMGAVYLASDKNLGGVLRAVKEMVQSYIEDEQQEKAVSDFKRESLLLTSLDHQSIPTIYDYFFDDKEARFYLVMKYISGGDLAGRLRAASESRIDEREVTQWAIQIADVLDYLHNRQPPIVYRDLKPANIMVDGNTGRVMLIDFGIARWVNKEEKGVTAVGTMGYAPPELFSGNVEVRSDIYSLGSTMFHLLTGADPQSNPLLIFDFQKHPRPRQINPQLSDQMERILMRSVEYSADKRFTSAAEFKRTLEEHLENLKQNRVTFGVKEAPSPLALSDQPVFCGFCGQKIVATDMFCAFCGAKQPLAQQGVHSHTEGYAPAPRTAQLLIIGTNDLEQPAFRLEKDENLVGRRDPMSNIFPEVDLSKFDPQTKISRRHARIWREGGEFMVEDLGSSNGTYILPVVRDTMRLQPHQPQLLTNGDKLKLGDTTLHFVLG